ncbi:MAG: Gp15 family bacteriophage protein [Eubacterium sp.]
MIGRLPDYLIVGNQQWKIRTDYRDILNIFCAFNDQELSVSEKIIVCLTILYVQFDDMAPDLYEEAYKQSIVFFNMGREEKNDRQLPKLMDWEQDETLIFAAVNKVAGTEVRACEYIHWWTFMSYYMGIGESLYSEVLNIREKKYKRKKLEKYEKEFYKNHKELIDLKHVYIKEELKEKEELERLIF